MNIPPTEVGAPIKVNFPCRISSADKARYSWSASKGDTDKNLKYLTTAKKKIAKSMMYFVFIQGVKLDRSSYTEKRCLHGVKTSQ